MLLSRKPEPSGKWSCAVTGTLRKNETYEQAIIRATSGKLGISGIRVVPEEKRFYEAPHPHFTQRFHAITTLSLPDFKPNPDEVPEIRWWTLEELKGALETEPDALLSVFAGHVRNFLSKEAP